MVIKRLLTKTCGERVRTENIINAQGNKKIWQNKQSNKGRDKEKKKETIQKSTKKIKKKTKMRTRVKIHHNHETSHFC